MTLLPAQGRYRFRSFVHLGDLADLRRRDVRFVVLHKAISDEMARGLGASGLHMKRWIRYYRAVFGAPTYDDDLMAVFDVEASPTARTTRARQQ